MATEFDYQKKSGILKANHESGALAVADDIAFDYNVTINALGTKEFHVTKNIKQKIDEIATALDNVDVGTVTAQDVTYNYTTQEEDQSTGETVQTTVQSNVKQQLDNLRQFNSTIGDPSYLAQQVALAQAASSSAQSLKAATESILQTRIQEITEITNSTKSKIAESNSKIDLLQDVASQLNTVFDTDGEFRIVSTTYYNGLSPAEIDDNVIYFCYDDNENSTLTSYYDITLSTEDSNKGTVFGGGNYASGTNVTIVAMPKNGYTFNKWVNNSDNSEDNTNPKVITVNQNLALTAYFNQIPVE